MPTIKSSADLRNNYAEIAAFCREHGEPVFITENGRGDLAVMSIEAYELLNARLELYRLLGEGEEDIRRGAVRPLGEAMAALREEAKGAAL